MAEPLLTRLPDAKAVLQTAASIRSGIDELQRGLDGLAQQAPGSPLGPLAAALGGLETRVGVDVSGLTERFPAALQTMHNAVAPGSVDFVRSIEDAYAGVRGFLDGSPLAGQLRGGSLEEVALGTVASLLDAFDTRVQSLGSGLLDPQLLAGVVATAEQLTGFETDFAAHRDELLPFLSRNLVGAPPELLDTVLAHVASARSVVDGLAAPAVEAALAAPTAQLAAAVDGVQAAVADLDPADPADHNGVVAALDAAEQAITGLAAAVRPLYVTVRATVEAHPWDAIFPGLVAALEAVDLDATTFLDDVVADVAGVLDALLARIQTVFGPADLADRMDRLTAGIVELLASSPLNRVRDALRGFLEQIRDAIAAVPVEEARAAVEAMLGRIGREVDALDAGRLADAMVNGFAQVEAFVTEQIDDALGGAVQAAVQAMVDAVDRLPTATLSGALDQVIAQVDSVVGAVEAALQDAAATLDELAGGLDEISFAPVGDAVLAEIDDLRGRLEQIRPEALSDAERLALTAALAVVRAIDLDGFIAGTVRVPFDAAREALSAGLDDIAAVLQTVRERVDGYRPDALLASVTAVTGVIRGALDGLTARAVTTPLFDRLDATEARLAALAPGRLLDPLEPPFRTVHDAVDQLDPDRLVQPLGAVFGRIGELVDLVDVTRLFTELDRRRRELFGTVRGSILGGLDALDLPEPLAGFVETLRPVLDAVTEALFTDPDGGLRGLATELSADGRLSQLFAPLDRAFDDLYRGLTAVPEPDLVAAADALRVRLVAGLDGSDPQDILRGFRSGLADLADLAPLVVFGAAAELPGLRAAYVERADAGPPASVAAVLSRFDAVADLVAPTGAVAGPLAALHADAEGVLAARIGGLDPAPAEAAYGRVRDGLDRAVPAFLRGAEPLTPDAVTAGIAAMRPSLGVGPVDAAFDRFLALVRPMQEALAPAVDGFFRMLRDTLTLVDPLALRDDVAEIATAIRAKLQVLDPAALADELRTALFAPAVAALEAIDPAALHDRLDAAFRSATSALTERVRALLDDVIVALDGQLARLRSTVTAVVDQVDGAVEGALGRFTALTDRLERLVFVDVLARVRALLDALAVGFDTEVNRVRAAFGAMLAAVPLAASGEVTT